MMYSPNLPIEEQRRLDQWWRNQVAEAQARPQSQLGSTRTGLDSMFDDSGQPIPRPADQAAPTKDIYDSWTSEQKSEWDRYGEFGKPLIPFGEGTEVLPQLGIRMPQPEDPLPGPPNRPPPDFPQPGGRMPRPGRGRGFLNRFERLLDGLEGLVGKLGGESPEDTSPLVDPVGGIGGLTPTPFTASQDY